VNLALVGNNTLRSAIQRNLVSFPSQIPAFTKGGDTHERIVQLYFVRHWPTRAICDRYGIGRSTVRKLLSEWKVRAVSAGYIQDVDPEALTVLASEEHVDHFTASKTTWEMALPQRSVRIVSAA